MLFLKIINWINGKWNSFVFYIHDLTARWGIGHTSVWFYDKMHWTLPMKWQRIAGKTHEQYLLEHELYLARHQAQYYANLAYEYQWAYLDLVLPEEESEEIINEELNKDKERI